MLDFISLTDGYKIDHRRQYEPGTEYVYANFTPRTGRVDGVTKVPFILLDHALDEYLVENAQKTFFGRPKSAVCSEYQDLVNAYFGPNNIGTQHIADLHDLGHIPLEFKAFPEGTQVPLKIPMFTVENTDPRFFWVTNYFETLLSSVIWQGCTNAAMAKQFYELFRKGAIESGVEDLSCLNYQGHDFSFRGMAGPEAAARSGVGHLLYFLGTDCLPSVKLIGRHYITAKGEALGQSIPATEHSVMCAGTKEKEFETYERLLDLYPTGPVAAVSDTWDLWNVIDNYLPRLKDKIMARNGKLVIRPDSGDPVLILTGNPGSKNATERQGVIRALWGIFGGANTKKGFGVLDPHIGAVYGDSITLGRAGLINNLLLSKGLATTNWVAGIGSYTYQYNTRDVYGMAMKSTWVQVNGQERQIQKDPVTDKSGKKSAKGRIVVVGGDDNLHMVDGLSKAEAAKFDSVNRHTVVWRDGKKAADNRWGHMKELARK